jgi:glycolate oxidase iron-sulfur subunit
VLCGKCLEVCPLFDATGNEELSPRAKFHLAAAMAGKNPAVSEKAAVELAARCLSCGKCEKACPLGLCAPELVSGMRAAHPNIESKLWWAWVEKARVLWPMMATLSRLVPRVNRGGYAGLLSSLKAMDPGERLTPWLGIASLPDIGASRSLAIFPGCVASHAKTHWSDRARSLLAGLGFSLLRQPEFACCGCTLGHAGLKNSQLDMQRLNVEAWRFAGRPLLAVFCATCRFGLSGYVTRDLGWGEGEREAWLAAVTPLSDLAAHGVYEARPGAPAKVHFHAPCHGARGGHDQRFLLAALGPRISARTRKNLCCGFGGALKLSAPELSDTVARRCMEFYAPNPGDQMLSGCSGCVIQLHANRPAGVDVGHWLEILLP